MSEGNFEKGSMDMSAHNRMWDDFVAMSKWGTGICILIVVLLAAFVA